MKSRISLISLPLLALLSSQGASAGIISQPTVERTAPDAVTIRWADKSAVDVFEADRADADIASAKLVSGKDKDGKAEVKVGEAARPYFLLRDTKTGEVSKVAERVVPLHQGSNFRDIGGYETDIGKHVRWGMIYRSGGQPLLTDADVQEVKGLGLANLVDLRSNEERSLAPTRLDGIPYKAVGYSMGSMMAAGGGKIGQNSGNPMDGVEKVYRKFPTQLAPQVRLVFHTLLSKEGPLVYNCSAGQDRTGFTTGLILSALGVPRATIYADYALSPVYRRPEWEMPKIDDATAQSNAAAAYFARFQKNPAAGKPQILATPEGKPYLAFALEQIDAQWGSVDTYLQNEIGLTSIDLAALRANYTE
jgi:protein-tyrosine phosphatase